MYKEIFRISPSRLFSKIDDYIQCKILKLNMRKIFIFDSIGKKIGCFTLHVYFLSALKVAIHNTSLFASSSFPRGLVTLSPCLAKFTRG